jgi:hypothetical protein
VAWAFLRLAGLMGGQRQQDSHQPQRLRLQLYNYVAGEWAAHLRVPSARWFSCS